MREFKFRVWDENLNRMGKMWAVNFETKQVSYLHGGEGYQVPLDSVKMMQFTGLKDKSGKEIYEGDIVHHYLPSGDYYEQEIDQKLAVEYLEGCYNLIELVGTIEVIGNIMENPELLK